MFSLKQHQERKLLELLPKKRLSFLLRLVKQSEKQNVQMIEMEPNPLNIEVRTQRDGIGTDRGM